MRAEGKVIFLVRMNGGGFAVMGIKGKEPGTMRTHIPFSFENVASETAIMTAVVEEVIGLVDYVDHFKPRDTRVIRNEKKPNGDIEMVVAVLMNTPVQEFSVPGKSTLIAFIYGDDPNEEDADIHTALSYYNSLPRQDPTMSSD